MKRPELKLGKPSVKVPPVVEDLYRDLRDRRLLPLVALLVVAIVAVPIALSASGGAPATTGTPAAEIVPADAPEAQAAVLAENPGLRDYRKRLDALKAQNPFEQQFETSGLEGTEVESGTETLDSVTAGGGDVAAADTGGSTSIPGSGSTTSSPDTSTGSTEPVGGGTPGGEPEVFFYSFVTDLRYGLEGDVKERRNVKFLDMLSPVGTFLGASVDRSTAVFGLSSSVLSVSGDGECVPSPDACEFLSLEKGKSAVLSYQRPTDPAAANYRITIEDIRVVKVKEPPVIE